MLVFEPGTDVYRARQLVQERLTQAHALPNVSKPPTLLQPLSSSSRVMMIGLSSDELTPIEQSVIARWTMRPRLMGVPGVANVAVWGMRDQQLQVQVDPEQLRDRDVTLNQVVSTAGNAQAVSPLTFLEASTPGTGGFIETPQQRLQVRNVLEQLADPAELGKVPVEGTGGRLRLSDVSDVTVDHQPLIGDAVVDGGEGLLLVVEKFPGANTLEVTGGRRGRARDAAARPRRACRPTRRSSARRRSSRTATDNLTLAIIIGGALLRARPRRAAVPVAHAARRAGRRSRCRSSRPRSCSSRSARRSTRSRSRGSRSPSRSSSTRRSSAPRASPAGCASGAPRAAATSTAAIVLEASAEVRGPLDLRDADRAAGDRARSPSWTGRPGAFFEPLVLAYALAVVAALVVALTVTPALSALLFALGKPALRESPLLRAAAAALRRRAGAVLARGRARR